MARPETTRTDDEDAIQRVFDAEREAEEEIARCEAACSEALRAARQAAADIATRAEHRLAAFRRSLEASAEERIRALGARGVQDLRGDGPSESEGQRIARAAAALARELIGTRA